MPELLTQSKTPDCPGKWPELNRNGGRLQIGTVADIKSESPAGLRRNPQAAQGFSSCEHGATVFLCLAR